MGQGCPSIVGENSMPFVGRDGDGRINAVSVQANIACGEQLSENNGELLEYLRQLDIPAVAEVDSETEATLIRSDLDLVRVMEDLANVLIEKNVICFTDLPYVAQQKIIRRRDIRESIQQDPSLIDDDQSLI